MSDLLSLHCTTHSLSGGGMIMATRVCAFKCEQPEAIHGNKRVAKAILLSTWKNAHARDANRPTNEELGRALYRSGTIAPAMIEFFTDRCG